MQLTVVCTPWTIQAFALLAVLMPKVVSQMPSGMSVRNAANARFMELSKYCFACYKKNGPGCIEIRAIQPRVRLKRLRLSRISLILQYLIIRRVLRFCRVNLICRALRAIRLRLGRVIRKCRVYGVILCRVGRFIGLR